MHLLRLIFCSLIFVLPGFVSAKDVRILAHHPSRYNLYSTEVLKHALSYHGDKYSVSYLVLESDLAREIEFLDKGKLSVVWMPTTNALEQKFIPVRVPIFGGLLAHRILMIRPESQASFNNVHTFNDLQKFSYGQGESWVDTVILDYNKLPIVTSAIYFRLFDMLHHGRFDAFPRGITEPWTELKANADLDLTVEKHILLSYKLPIYFFVTKENQALARDLEIGMNKAVDDGSLRRLLNDDPDLVAGLKRLDLKNRRVFELKNPSLPAETPVDVKKYWISIDDLIKTALMSEQVKDAFDMSNKKPRKVDAQLDDE